MSGFVCLAVLFACLLFQPFLTTGHTIRTSSRSVLHLLLYEGQLLPLTAVKEVASLYTFVPHQGHSIDAVSDQNHCKPITYRQVVLAAELCSTIKLDCVQNHICYTEA